MPVGPKLPRDQYAHPGAPKEWWWHTGTLVAADRVFGFEINVSGVYDPDAPADSFQYVELMVTDLKDNRHYQITNGLPWSDDWAQSDPSKPWYANLVAPDNSWGAYMASDLATPDTMTVKAWFTDASGMYVPIELTLTQNGVPLFVWGTGVHEVDPTKTNPLERYNYYYSFTKLSASGTIGIDGIQYPVEGVTWMDHEYGGFATGMKWILQDAQLNNGIHLSNFSTTTDVHEGIKIESNATILTLDGDSIFVKTFVTPLGPTWTDSVGITYCLTMLVEIPDCRASLTIESRFADQEFAAGPVYEGVAWVTGTWEGQDVSGTGWIEQVLQKPAAGPASAIAHLLNKA